MRWLIQNRFNPINKSGNCRFYFMQIIINFIIIGAHYTCIMAAVSSVLQKYNIGTFPNRVNPKHRVGAHHFGACTVLGRTILVHALLWCSHAPIWCRGVTPRASAKASVNS